MTADKHHLLFDGLTLTKVTKAFCSTDHWLNQQKMSIEARTKGEELRVKQTKTHFRSTL